MNYKYLFLFGFLHLPTVQAADGLGRLFLTPDQRIQLEAIRVKRDPRQPINVEPEAFTSAPVPVPQGPETVTYSGAVRRSDGKSTVWINGKPLDERMRTRGANDIKVMGMRADGAVSVALPHPPLTASLKIGQRLEVSSGKIEESYIRPNTEPRRFENAATISKWPIVPRQPDARGDSSSRMRKSHLRADYYEEVSTESDAGLPVERGPHK